MREQKVVLVDEAPYRFLEILDALEARVPDEPPVEYAEEYLDLV